MAQTNARSWWKHKAWGEAKRNPRIRQRQEPSARSVRQVEVEGQHLAQYRAIARKAGKVWRAYGAVQYVEAVGDDLDGKFGISFTKTIKVKPGETVVFSWIVFKSRAHRDSVNKKVMNDPRLKKMMEKGPMPFDVKRMAYGGFKFLVEA